MAIKGSLSEASLPDVLQLLAMGRKTGCLSVTDRSNFGNIFFERGQISYASIVNRKDRLGDLLVKNGLLDAETLDRAIEEQHRRPSVRLGEILVDLGAVTQEQVEDFIRLQIEEAVYLLFTWMEGSFYFEADQRPEPGALLVSINPENLLLEGARRIDEWGLIEKKIPSLDLVFRLERDPLRDDQLELTREQRKVIPLLDGRRTVRDVVEESGMVEFDVGKAIFGLIQAGFATQAGERETGRGDGAVAAARVEEHRNLGIAFYRTGMFEEAVREFRRVAELEPDGVEAWFHLGLIGLRTRDDRGAIRSLKKVAQGGRPHPAALHAMGLALERLGRLDDATAALEAAEVLSPGLPDLPLSRGIVELKAGRFQEAVQAFRRYRDRLPNGETPAEAYYAFAPLAEEAAGHDADADALAGEGGSRYPESAIVQLHLGAVLERHGRHDQAEAAYQRAVDAGGDLARAHKALGDMRYRRGAYAEAAVCYEEAARLDPELGDDLYLKLGNIHYKHHERAEAVRWWTRALELNPQNGIARTNLELVRKFDPGATA